MIYCKVPLRISFVGGGTDHINYSKNVGSVISISIDKFVYVFLNKSREHSYKLSYSKKENVSTINQINHPIFRECLKYFKIYKGIELSSVADIHSRGSGLGSSSSFTVCLIKVLNKFLNIKMKDIEIANLASEIEIKKCKKFIGKQDQFQAAFGGFNQFNFNSDGSVSVNKIKINKKRFDLFKKKLVIYSTGKFRKADKILKHIPINSAKIKKNFNELTSLVKDFKYELLHGDLNNCGNILDASWKIKKGFAKNVSNRSIDEIYSIGKRAGALGGKVLGAGGGGFVMFFGDQKSQKKIEKKLYNLQKLKFDFFLDKYNAKSI